MKNLRWNTLPEALEETTKDKIFKFLKSINGKVTINLSYFKPLRLTKTKAERLEAIKVKNPHVESMINVLGLY